ncbi:unnamed protein product [Gongylonema pulchrum]|uniref:FGGY_N domain-containing protein n=1 Tax=Gongylonema pulchrum TaxID=637853 RepID=A0A183E816_9BILA|nr:unnamed protein product [Gongylonema pulchrum]
MQLDSDEVLNGSGGALLAVDVGTTTIRACLFDSCCRLMRHVEEPVSCFGNCAGLPVAAVTVRLFQICVQFGGSSEEGIRAEIDPDLLWKQFVSLVSQLLDETRERAHGVAAMGICCQRNTFICWDRESGKPCHNFITWKDSRARNACRMWNNSWTVKMINFIGFMMHMLTRSARFRAARIFSFLNAMVTHRLLVTLAEVSQLYSDLCGPLQIVSADV